MRIILLAALALSGCAMLPPTGTTTERPRAAIYDAKSQSLCADLNGDGVVDFADLAEMKDQFTTECIGLASTDRMLICQSFTWNVNTDVVPPILVLPDIDTVRDEWVIDGTWRPGHVVAPVLTSCALLVDGLFLPVVVMVDPGSWEDT